MSRAAELIVPAAEIEAFLAAHGWRWEQLERGDIELGGKPVTLADIQAFLLFTDPVIWCEANLVNRPEDGGGLWRLFDYQKPSMRFRGAVVHEDGAEVGKTREIVGLLLWGSVCNTGGQLVGSMGDGSLGDIWRECEWQLDNNPWLRSQLKKIALKPYRMQEWSNGNVNDFRPGGFDGRAFRGVHVAQRLSLDEAAKAEAEQVLSEFFRAGKPGAEPRIYSVPDGRRTSPYSKLVERAIPFEGIARAAGRPVRSLADAGVAADDQRFVRFHWPKTIMPSPFWDAAREAAAVEQYGGRDSAGYVRNVLGQQGDPEYSVFPFAQFGPCVRMVEEYVVVKLLRDNATRTIYCTAHQLTPGYQVRQSADLEDAADLAGRGPSPLTELYQGSFAFGNVDLASVLRRWLLAPPEGTHLVGGADVGKNEETEIGLSELRGLHRRWRLRIQLRHFSYDDQAEVFRLVDSAFTPDHGWGLDAGGVGTVLEDTIRGGAGGWHFDGRLSGFVFNNRIPLLDVNEEQAIDPVTGRPRTILVKELATQLLEKAMQRGELVVPWDPDYIRDFPAHTSKQLPSGERTFSRERDHVVDEKRVELLRLYELEHGLQTIVEPAFALPPNSRRDSAGLMESY